MKLSHLSLAVFSAIALAACGGSGSSSSVDDSSKNKGKEDENKTKVEVTQPKLSEKVKVEIGAPLAGMLTDAKKTADDFPGNPGTDLVTFIKPTGGVLQTKVQEVAYLPNPDLYNDKTKLKLETNLADTVKANAQESTVVYYKNDKGEFVKAFAALADDDNYYYVKADDKPEAAKKAKASKALKADELYQVQDLSFTNVKNFKVLGQDVKPLYGFTGKKRFAALDRTKIEMGKIVSAPVTAEFEVNNFALAADPATATNGLEKLTKEATGYKEATNLDGAKKGLKADMSVKIGEVKAYNLPYSFAAISTQADKANPTAQNFVLDEVSAQGIMVEGLPVVLLPENVKADYTGKAFTAKSEGDITVSVSFKGGEKAVIDTVKIANRKDKDGGSLETLVSEVPVGLNDANGNYTAKLVMESDATKTSNEIKSLQGKFYGLNAEETAGTLYKADNATNPVGVYAAQK